MLKVIKAIQAWLLAFAITSCSNVQPVSKSLPGARSADKAGYTVFGKTYRVLPDSKGYLEIGIASWYGKKFHGQLTANGETYDMYRLSAAHKALPLPTIVKVTNLDNGRKTIVRVNDRGPFHDDRVIDLSYKAALELGFADKGTAPVVVEALDRENYPKLFANQHPGRTYYLQVGAFSRLEGAEHLMNQIQQLLVTMIGNTNVQILESELDDEILHKVWIGPIATIAEKERISMMVVSAALGEPIKVEVN